MPTTTIAQLKELQTTLGTCSPTGIIVKPGTAVMTRLMDAIDQTILFQEAWGDDLGAIQLALRNLRAFLAEFAVCRPEDFPAFRVRLGVQLNAIDARLAAIERVKYSP